MFSLEIMVKMLVAHQLLHCLLYAFDLQKIYLLVFFILNGRLSNYLSDINFSFYKNMHSLICKY